MENGYGADARAQVFWIGHDRDQRFGRRLEQNVIDRRLVLIGNVGDGCRQREHEVIIGNGQEFGFALGEPRPGRRALTLRAMTVTAGVVGDDRVGAILAARDMAAKRLFSHTVGLLVIAILTAIIARCVHLPYTVGCSLSERQDRRRRKVHELY
jgi:hypothetical protein